MIYESKALPAAWVVYVDEQLWIVPACRAGWNARKQFRGHRSALRPVGSYNLVGLGVPPQTQISDRERLELRDLLESTQTPQSAAATMVHVPLRTMQDWLGGQRQMHRAIYERLMQNLSTPDKK